MMSSQTERLWTVLVLAVAGGIGAGWFVPNPVGAAPEGPVDFNHDIRPILSNNCFKCHGPDTNERKAGLRLDVRAEALKPTESGRKAIVPGKPEASALVNRIFSTKESRVMPPPESDKKLTA